MLFHISSRLFPNTLDHALAELFHEHPLNDEADCGGFPTLDASTTRLYIIQQIWAVVNRQT